MQRYEDWPRRLNDFVALARERRFRWGTHDCMLFAADAVQAITGVDPARPYRGIYRNRREAERLMKEYAGGGVSKLTELVTEDHSIPEIPPLMAQRGDVCLVEVSSREALGVAVGSIILVAALPKGVAAVPLTGALRAWRI